MAVSIYGIANCDTMRKARRWLDEHGIAHAFQDYRVAGVDRDMVERWVAALGWEVVLNRAGTTFRALPEADRAGLDGPRAIDLMVARPAMIKRPMLDRDGRFTAGFKPDIYEGLFAA